MYRFAILPCYAKYLDSISENARICARFEENWFRFILIEFQIAMTPFFKSKSSESFDPTISPSRYVIYIRLHLATALYSL